MQNIEQLDGFYDKSSVEGKRYLISFLVQPKNNILNWHLSNKMNEIAQHIYL